MSLKEKDCLYVFDTSSFIELVSRYPPDISHFFSIWKLVEDSIRHGRLITHEFVVYELSRKDDYIYRWVRERGRLWKHFVRRPDGFQFDKVREIVNRYPSISGVKEKDFPFHADPFLIALAIEEKEQARLSVELNVLIITEEMFDPRRTLEENRIGIPRISREYGIETDNVLGFLKREEKAGDVGCD